MRNICKWVKGVYCGVIEFFKVGYELKSAEKKPLAKACRNCGCKFGVIIYLPQTNSLSFNELAPIPFLATIVTTITVCADCGKPV